MTISTTPKVLRLGRRPWVLCTLLACACGSPEFDQSDPPDALRDSRDLGTADARVQSELGTCDTPVDLVAEGGHVAWTTAGRPDQLSPCVGGVGSGEVVLSYTPAEDGTLVVSTNHGGTMLDTLVAVMSLCDADHRLACNDDVSERNHRSTLRMAVEGGLPLWIVVDGYHSEGRFEVTAELLPVLEERDECADDRATALCGRGLECVDGLCAPFCPYTNDGFCDEPEGSGDCPDGSDPVDCTPCPEYSHATAPGVCECDESRVRSVDGERCEIRGCTLGGDECPVEQSCGYDPQLRRLRCRTAGERDHLVAGCIPWQEGVQIEAEYLCSHQLACAWPSCSAAALCARLCRTATDCEGEFVCDEGRCAHFVGADVGICQ